MNPSQSSSFGLYETARILVPGFYFSSLGLLMYYAFLFHYVPIERNPLIVLYLFLVLVSGLTMYAKETTKRRRAFVENQPSSYLHNIVRRSSSSNVLTETESRQLYFYILNHYFPSPFHDKVFFFGTVYHIMIQIRRTSFLFSIAALLCVAVLMALGIALSDQQGLILFTVFVSVIYLLNVRYNKADRKMQENYLDQIFWLQMNGELLKDLLRKYEHAKKDTAS